MESDLSDTLMQESSLRSNLLDILQGLPKGAITRHLRYLDNVLLDGELLSNESTPPVPIPSLPQIKSPIDAPKSMPCVKVEVSRDGSSVSVLLHFAPTEK